MTVAKMRKINKLWGMSKMLMLMFIFLVGSCKKDDDIKPSGNSQAIPVYNQAYTENYTADNIDDIIREAKNAYVLVDPFMSGVADQISAIKAENNAVGGYISIGTGEDWRDDFSDLQPFLVSKQWDEWEGEFYVKETTTGIIPIMKERIDKMAAWGCDWVEFDNMDWFFDEATRAEYGITATEEEGILYYQELCNYVHSKGMKCMAKNHVVEANDFDGVLYESYHNDKNWWDNAGAQSFLDAGKLVIVNHYNESKPNAVYAEYIDIYGAGVSYICESKKEKKYIHYNQ